jgi:tRNA (guanine-N7-)-methyltransferase
MPLKFKSEKSVNILDVGCGYGGLLFNMSTSLGPEDLALGMEIRDKVSNFVGDKIKSLRVNSDHSQYSNIGILRTNTMKLLLNYFYKEQLDKIFFCFPDPHFKKYNHRKRIIK